MSLPPTFSMATTQRLDGKQRGAPGVRACVRFMQSGATWNQRDPAPPAPPLFTKVL